MRQMLAHYNHTVLETIILLMSVKRTGFGPWYQIFQILEPLPSYTGKKLISVTMVHLFKCNGEVVSGDQIIISTLKC